MIYSYGGDKIVEGNTFSDIVEDLMDKDFALPLFKIQYKWNLVNRTHLSPEDILKSDTEFIKTLVRENIIHRMKRIFITKSDREEHVYFRGKTKLKREQNVTIDGEEYETYLVPADEFLCRENLELAEDGRLGYIV